MTELVQLGAPKKNLNSVWSQNIRDHFPFDVVRPAQEQGFQAVEEAYRTNKKFIIIEAPTGAGKCLKPGTLILMFDGTTKKVEDVVVGDLVMGDDSTPRRVVQLSSGTGNMFDVVPVKGETYRVNDRHVLSLKAAKGVKTLKIDIPLEEYRLLSQTQKHTLKGYRTGVDFPSQELPVPPYFIGLWLGNGLSCNTGVRITTAGEEVVSYLYEVAREWGLSVTPDRKSARTYNLVTPRGQSANYFARSRNPLLSALQGLNVLKNKHIPQIYLSNSYGNRLALLAGLIDSNSSRVRGSGFDFVFKRRTLAEGVTFLCRSLGMAAYMKPRKKICGNNGVESVYYRIGVSGGVSASYLPSYVKIPRKRPIHRLQKKDVLVHGIKVVPVGVGRYCGFEVDGNHRFLLADFTVVHNSGIAMAAGSFAKTQPAPPNFESGAYILSPQKSLTAQYMGDFADMGLVELKGRSNYTCTRFEEDGQPVDCEIGGMLCSQEKNDDGSTGCSFCPYKEAKKAFVQNPLGVTNFSYYLNETSYAGQLNPRKMLTIDEAHNCEGQILSMADIVINKWRCEEVSLDFLSLPVVKPGQSSKGADWLRGTYTVAANVLIAKWESDLTDLKEDGNTGSAAALGKKLNGLKRFMGKVNLFLNSFEENYGDWIVYTDETKGSESYGCLIIKPLTATLFADNILFSKADKVVLLSATIGDFKFFMRNLGIDPNNAVCTRIVCDFPKENRPVFLKPVANMSSTKVGCPDCSTPENSGRENRSGKGCSRCYNSGQVPSIDVAMPKVAAFLDKLLSHKNYIDKKGIAHCNSYKITKFMTEHLSVENRNRVVTHTSAKGDRDNAIQRHIEAETPTVLFSPSMTEGLDLKDDLSRFSIICKTPFPYLDPYVKARMQRDSEWYASRVALALVQATGRSNRHKEDKAHHYILDAAIVNFLSRYSHLLPQWWMDAVVWP